jgi:hypothetical protein
VRAKPFDRESIAYQRRALIDKRVLTIWLLDHRSARQLGPPARPEDHWARRARHRLTAVPGRHQCVAMTSPSPGRKGSAGSVGTDTVEISSVGPRKNHVQSARSYGEKFVF